VPVEVLKNWMLPFDPGVYVKFAAVVQTFVTLMTAECVDVHEGELEATRMTV
jgi:hypothetical protein